MACTEDEFRELLGAETFVDVIKLREISEHGIPDTIRSEVWPYLLGVTNPVKTQVDKHSLKAYHDRLQVQDVDKTMTNDILRRIRSSVERYCNNTNEQFFQRADTRKALENILTVTYMNNDLEYSTELTWLLAPILFAVKKEEVAFFCFEALIAKIGTSLPLERIPQIVGHLMMLTRSIHPQLSSHLEEEGIQPNDWAQSWLRYLLSRELPLVSLLRLWDTYFSTNMGLGLHIYVALAILSHLSEELLQLDDAELKPRLQHLPMMDMDQIIAEAFNIYAETKQ